MYWNLFKLSPLSAPRLAFGLLDGLFWGRDGWKDPRSLKREYPPNWSSNMEREKTPYNTLYNPIHMEVWICLNGIFINKCGIVHFHVWFLEGSGGHFEFSAFSNISEPTRWIPQDNMIMHRTFRTGCWNSERAPKFCLLLLLSWDQATHGPRLQWPKNDLDFPWENHRFGGTNWTFSRFKWKLWYVILGRNCPKLLSPSTGIDWLVATGSTLDYKNLTIFMDCNNPQQDKTSLHRFSYDPPTVARHCSSGIFSALDHVLWVCVFFCSSTSRVDHCSAWPKYAWPQDPWHYLFKQFQFSKPNAKNSPIFGSL